VLVLGFDTSSPAVTVALGDVDPSADAVSVLAGQTEIAVNSHGELLARLIADVLSQSGTAPADLGAVAVGLGPGPFTGLRVGIVTARAMCDALAIPGYGECSLRLVGSTSAGVATNARRKQVYWAVFAGADSRGPELSSPTEAAAQFADAGVQVVSGEGPVLYPEAFAGFTRLDDEIYPRADRLLTCVAARVRAGAPSEGLMPMYLRRPDAQPPGPPKQVTPA
jgi:tRNA threonylcarbamoyl adenosine modification protein YeaZ